MSAEVVNIVLTIVNILMIPAVSMLTDSKIDEKPLVFCFRNVVLYSFYTVVVFAVSKIIAHLMNLILNARIGIYDMTYTFIALFAAAVIPLVKKLLVTRFDFKIDIRAGHEK
ncbi:MAG: hypothetical protein J5365_07420 [Erysipelotrichaceae bacterium]|nr:hypothetical protein [Erysipelotrichaceae bacterium]